MKLHELLNLCRYSELTGLAVKNDTEAVLSFINLGLIALYTRFPLRTEEHIIDLIDGKTIYDLPADFMHITGAFEASGKGVAINLPINEEGNPLSVNTINFSQVQIPLSITGTYVSIVYAAKPPYLTTDDLDREVPVPPQLLQPLLNFVAFKGHGAVRIDGQGQADIYYMRYKRSCDDVEKQGTAIASDDLSMNSRISSRGFP